ncbi:N-acetylmuramoyl-L-alanine amidase [Fulvimonas sp. R45]|uniref:N-acetylmuramoyl-L-alanine amidase n=1 Tax=Fulvimonas sp. R45 TaxID=3045937 RepID=UPI0026601FFC|nr:N-acetylmuramoyl-L-alanine amidase [Fulvimonas sp. R45]MDO1528488.1 N-acetylmuramoyl-L-alanine amidase [Fulvimonas sp. R45]
MRQTLPTPRLLRTTALLLALALLAACAHAPPRNPLATWVPSPNYDIRRPVLIVLHFTDEHSAQEALDTLRTRNSGGPVSAHYLIGSDGHVYQLVPDQLRAWQAGPGRWGTITDLNSASIGIELDNDGHTPFAQAQIDSLLRLLADLTTRLHIPPTQVIGHEDLAPGRKDDPGPYFPWAQLAAAGFGRWPSGPLCDPPPGFDPWMAMAVVGYALDDRAAVVRSFHHHFRGMQGDTLDAQDLRILYNLVQQIEPTANTCAAPSPPAD